MNNETKTMNTNLTNLTMTQLQQHFNHLGSFYSDLYKARHGIRPQMMPLSADQYESFAELTHAALQLNLLIECLSTI